MKTITLLLQLTLVVGLTAAVGVPQFREPVRAVTIWRTGGPLTPRPELVSSDSRFTYGETGPGARAGGSSSGTGQASDARRELQRQSADGTRNTGSNSRAVGGAAAGRVLISGRASTALNQPVPFARVLLRNIRTGEIQAQVTADSGGRFSFGDVLSSGYVIEMVGTDGAVIAASGLLSGNSGGIQQATLRVSGNSTARALFGSTGSSAGATTGSTLGTNAGATTGTTTGTLTTGTTTSTVTGSSTNTSGSGGGTIVIGSTASEPINRASELGIGQTAAPDEEASPRN
jgi:hypothetical protein